MSSKPTYLDLALKEWKILKDTLLDYYCAVFCTGDLEHETRFYSPEFIYIIMSQNNLDLREMLPSHRDDVNSILRECEVLKELIQDIQDDASEFMQAFNNVPADSFDPDVLDAISEDIYGVPYRE